MPGVAARRRRTAVRIRPPERSEPPRKESSINPIIILGFIVFVAGMGIATFAKTGNMKGIAFVVMLAGIGLGLMGLYVDHA